jgi:hypothetical protein
MAGCPCAICPCNRFQAVLSGQCSKSSVEFDRKNDRKSVRVGIVMAFVCAVKTRSDENHPSICLIVDADGDLRFAPIPVGIQNESRLAFS